MYYSKIEKIVEQIIGMEENPKLDSLKRHLHEIESEINNLARKEDAEIDDIVDRALELVKRNCNDNDSCSFYENNKDKIDREIRKELRGLQKGNS
ncbi:MAG: hypothetical protein COU40_01680 [Candidatus Moranbacteria bacterium CG10_big_fil_rev_8_21_14_0_10_35_21]|nr:MAG: hypothetical protein COU40_01680 [Candidatus Moranbacteria bacterium CG10_big_fil_rev_8_21_14_0_10_35_21]PJA88742.1 MAG: hypothetical protein CO139_01455 [Candidatus Moranbacteria bacterium CG_4_9_14_3_um_filter_36_9]